MGSGKMGQWFIGKISLDLGVKKCVTSFKSQHFIIPPFHYSIREAKNRAPKTSYIFNKL